ncbi:MAG: hypothetical protein P4L83_06085 [Nevskia sp.]|nr:hypothetical protein [Nevskia sp.]
MKVPLTLALLLVTAGAIAQEGWRNAQGHAAPDTHARRSVGGFGGWVVVTSDADWKQKWETPSNTIPNFTETKSVALGKQIFVLTFFANPQINADGAAQVTCDLDVIRPNGTSSVHQDGAVCFKGTLKEPRMTYLSAPVVGFVGDPGDPLGTWLVRITLHDNVRHVAVSLKTSFELVEK